MLVVRAKIDALIEAQSLPLGKVLPPFFPWRNVRNSEGICVVDWQQTLNELV
ncbi:hypothetical protein [Nostoc sp.]|uniref:hypothetical protein n=1 Tax=Nostoc sp. TaxID=1180 RepID=UPI002FF8B64B